MTKKLVIVESPAKAKTINKIIGKDYQVVASMGHIRDLPQKKLGVDIKRGFKPQYVVVKGREKIVEKLTKDAAKCEAIYLAPDPDREGEAIAWHLKELLGGEKANKKFFRVHYNEITPRAVRKAFENPAEIDDKRVNAQQARRILDRIVGYKVSPLLWQQVKRGLSAGRVQSVALRLVCDREKAIQEFVPEEYWILGANVRKLMVPLDPFYVKLARMNGEPAEVKSSEQADGVRADLEGRNLKVAQIIKRDISRKGPPPYVTSTLQQAGSRYFGISPERTMRIAQGLYEGVSLGAETVGLITYMRTDSFRVSQDALNDCRAHISESFGEEYLPEKPNFFKKKASAQEAHEAIRPTDVRRTPKSLEAKLDSASLKLYKAIWERFVASQMAPAKIAQRTIEVEAVPPAGKDSTYLFRATASEVVFQGYMKVSGTRDSNEKKGDDKHQKLPELKEGESLECIEWLGERKETQPPSRYSEASLIRALEENGVGRPSTYALIISTLIRRKYVLREKRTLIPQELGMDVSTFLVKNLPKLFDVKFTAEMEQALDEIEQGSIEWTSMLDKFYEKFAKWIEAAKGPPVPAATAQRLLDGLSGVTEWAPEVKRGKRVYSDEKYVTSIRETIGGGQETITQRQMLALAKIGARYRKQIKTLEPLLLEMGFEKIVKEGDTLKPRKSTLKKLDLLAEVDLDDSTKEFVDSLRSRAEGGRGLTPAQIRALDRVVVSNSKRIKDFESIKEDLNIEVDDEPDEESGPLLEQMGKVEKWNEPVKRGKRVFDDKSFYESLATQFSRKGRLSPRQKAALKKMAKRYDDQISGK